MTERATVGWTLPWIKARPKGWRLLRITRALRLSELRNDDGSNGELLSLSVSRGIIPKSYEDGSHERSGAELRKYFLVKPGQFVVNPMWLMHGSLGTAPISGVISPDYRVYDLTSDVDARYLHHLLKTREYLDLYGLLARGTTTYDRRISKDSFNDLPLLVPPLATQRAIANLLDRKTAAIDALIAKKRRLVELLAEKRAALINQAVTKGLDPTVPMKDSGIPWIGEIPAHWDARTVRRVTAAIEQGWSPLCENRLTVQGEWGVLKVGCVNGGEFRATEHKALSAGLVPIPRLEIRKGDLLMSRANTSELLGSTAVVGETPPRLLLCDKIYRIAPMANCDSKFFAFAMASRSVRAQFESSSSGASDSMQNISQDRLRDVCLAMPPIDEQQAIAASLEDRLKAHQQIADALSAQIGKLQEYRQALITAAVTGQLEIPVTKPEEVMV